MDQEHLVVALRPGYWLAVVNSFSVHSGNTSANTIRRRLEGLLHKDICKFMQFCPFFGGYGGPRPQQCSMVTPGSAFILLPGILSALAPHALEIKKKKIRVFWPSQSRLMIKDPPFLWLSSKQPNSGSGPSWFPSGTKSEGYIQVNVQEHQATRFPWTF